MDEMYLVNIYGIERTTTAESGETKDFLDQYCDITNSDGETIYSGRSFTSNIGPHGDLYFQDLNTLAKLLFLNEPSSRPLFCLISSVRDVDTDRFIAYSSRELRNLVSGLNDFGQTKWYRFAKDEVPNVNDPEPMLYPVEVTPPGGIVIDNKP